MKVLFMGSSITGDQPKTETGCDENYGMATKSTPSEILRSRMFS